MSDTVRMGCTPDGTRPAWVWPKAKLKRGVRKAERSRAGHVARCGGPCAHFMMLTMVYGGRQAVCRMVEVMGAAVPLCRDPAPGKDGWSGRTITTKPPECGKAGGPARAAGLGLNNPAGGVVRLHFGY